MTKLLKILSENAHITNEELAVLTGLTEKEVCENITKLEKDGIICGYKTLINWDKVEDNRVTALIKLKATPQKSSGFDEIANHIMSFEEVESLYLMSGTYDLSVIVQGKNFHEVALFVAQRLSTIESVQQTATHFVLKRYKDMGTELSDKLDDRGNISLC